MFTKVWDQAGIELVAPGSAVRQASVVSHVTDCAYLWHDEAKRNLMQVNFILFIDYYRWTSQAEATMILFWEP